MRWSIRQQVLVPIVAIQTLSIAAITIVSIALAAADRAADRRAVERGRRCAGRIQLSLDRRHSGQDAQPFGARFVAYGPAGQPVAASDPGLAASPCVTGHSGPQPGSLRQPQRVADARGQRSEPFRGAHRPALIELGDGLAGTLFRVKLARCTVGVGPGPFDTRGRGAGLMAAATTWIAHRISGRIHRLEHQVARIAEGDFRELRWTRSRHATRSTTWPDRSTGCAPSFGR